MTRIAIIGAGLSGRLLAFNLCRQASSAVGIRMIDRGDARYMGPAYSPEMDCMLLNVPAGRMGALPDDQEHFLKWARERGVRADPWDFLPRRLYRDYVVDLLETVRRERTDGPRFEHVRGEVTDIEVGRGGATIHLESAEPLVADRAVLALGNFPPRHPPIENRAALEDGRYVRNPWAPGILDSLPRGDTALLIGTGQTMVDLTVALEKRAHQGRIVALSRHGLLPMPHRGFEPYPSFFEEIEGSRRIRDMFRIVRGHFERAESMGMDGRAVIDSLRPDTQTLWRGLSEEEKRRFLRHVFRHWEIIRSRIPPESEAVLQRMRVSGQLEIVAGRIRDLVETEKALEVRYTPSGGARDVVVRAGLVINCMGPEPDYSRVNQALVRNLRRRGLIRPGPANLGIDALPDGGIVGRDGSSSGILYTLGSPMKGVLWEVLAVPEIRVQAQRLAHLLLEDDPERLSKKRRPPPAERNEHLEG